ncbi:MAG: tetratricopeptide repeat protein [Chloroflexi bacterium]|nr:tetratricopeptide repeat protein [Chloroflexota bacterium]
MIKTFATNLPLQLTSFVGRQPEMAEVKRLLCSESARLVTLMGAGGSGKTRLALQVANDLLDDFPDGVWLVELAPLSDPALVPQALASVFELRKVSEDSPIRVLTNYLRSKILLLVLDNCEHLDDACGLIADQLLRACPRLRIITTSRQALGILGETTWRVPSLTMPDVTALAKPGADWVSALTQSEAARLFVDRALAVLPTFRLTERNAGTVAQLCQRLDGLPLAIELAAARVKSLSVEEIAAHLDDCFQLLTAGNRAALPRQQTLRATIDWSYDLLTEEERRLFRRLSVFAGGWTLEAAEQVCASVGVWASLPHPETPILDLLSRLVDKSLVVAEEENGQTRYRMLETIRQYAREKLGTLGEEQDASRRHFQFVAKKAAESTRALKTPDRVAALAWLDQELDNLRAAIEWTLQSGEVNQGLQLAGGLREFWYMHGHLSEGRSWLEKLLTRASGDDRVDSVSRGDALTALSQLNYRQGNFEQARQLADQVVTIARASGAKNRIATAVGQVGLAAQELGDYAQAEACYQESVALMRELGDWRVVAIGLNNLGYLQSQRANFERAIRLLEESVAIHRRRGDRYETAYPLCNLGDIARRQGDYARAALLYDECLTVCREMKHTWGIARLLGRLGENALGQGDVPRAADLQIESLRLRHELDDREGMVCCLEGLARVALAQNQLERAARLFGTAEQWRESIRAPLAPAECVEYERNLHALRLQLDPAVFAGQWAAGRALTLAQAIEYALADARASDQRVRVVKPAEPELRIFSLGTPRVLRGARELGSADWRYSKTREMFFYLLCHPCRTKEQIGVVLWPDASDAQLRSNFRVALYHLRQALGRSEWILFENDQYAFNRDLPFWFDVEHFEQGVAEARKPAPQEQASAIQRLQSAVNLYRGEFLQGSPGEWFCQRQQELERAYLDALLLLGALLFAQAEYAQAGDAYRKAIATDKYLESAHRELMRCHARLGEHGQALKHYHELTELLREEMGASPAPETQTVFERIRQGKEI